MSPYFDDNSIEATEVCRRVAIIVWALIASFIYACL